ncbi:hypothetical protein C7M52_01125 [Mixta theicola]|nr:hypothetical protein [Mixta theicola]QHM75176.1 hypothetical protein C7M52_01125 [Mixta theicola]
MQKESRTDKWLRTGFVLFLIILLLLIIFNGTAKTSDVSNWIIAFANIVMAYAAVRAYLAARQFLSEFFAQEGYRLAIALINENVIHLGNKNRYTIAISSALCCCKELHSLPHTREGNKKLQSALVLLTNLHKAHKKWLSDINSLLERMETYGIYPADNKKAALTGVITALDEMLMNGDSFIAVLRKNACDYNKVADKGVNMSKPFSAEEMDVMTKSLEEITTQWNMMVSNRNELLAGVRHARALFKVREYDYSEP